MLRIWRENVQRYQKVPWQPTRNSLLCSEHFEKNEFNFSSEDLMRHRLGLPRQKRIFLKPSAIPTLFLNGVISCHESRKKTGPKKSKYQLVEDAAHTEAFGCRKDDKRNEIASYNFSNNAYLSIENVREDGKHANQIATPRPSLCSEHFEKDFKIFREEYRRKLKGLPKEGLLKSLPLNPPLKPTAVTKVLSKTEAETLVPEIKNQEIKLDSEVTATWGIIMPKTAFEDSLRMAMQSAMESFEINITVPNYSVEMQTQPEMSSKETSIKLTIVFNIQSKQETCQIEKSTDFSSSADCAEFNFNSCVIKEEPKEILNDEETVNIACDELKGDCSKEAKNMNFGCTVKQEYVLPEATFDENRSPLSVTLPERIPSPFEPANTVTHFKTEVMDSIEVSVNDNFDISDSSFSEKAVLNSPCHIVTTDMSHANDNFLITKVANNLNFMKLKSELCY